MHCAWSRDDHSGDQGGKGVFLDAWWDLYYQRDA